MAFGIQRMDVAFPANKEFCTLGDSGRYERFEAGERVGGNHGAHVDILFVQSGPNFQPFNSGFEDLNKVSVDFWEGDNSCRYFS